MLSNKRGLLLFMVSLFIVLVFFSTTRSFEWDEAHHANTALFFSTFVTDWIREPTFSISSVRNYAIEYHSHYKFLTVAAAYPPLNMILLTITYLVFGVNVLTTRLVSIFWALVLVFFTYRLAKLYYDRDGLFPLACAVLVAFNPVMFLLLDSNYPGAGLTALVIMSTYFLVKFIRTERKNHLYLFSISLALGILQKPTMLLMTVPFAYAILYGKNFRLLTSEKMQTLKSLILFFVFLSPLIIQLGILYHLGVTDIFFDHWIRDNPGTTLLFIPHFTSLQAGNFIQIMTTLSFQIFTPPFILIGLYYSLKRRREIDRMFILSLVVFIYIFTIQPFSAERRYLAPVLPFLTIIWVHGLFMFLDKIPGRGIIDRRTAKIITLSIIAIISLLSGISYSFENNCVRNDNVDDAALFVIGNTTSETTVLTSFGQPQAFDFARFDSERNIYVAYLPREEENIPSAVMGNFSYYVSSDLWKKFGVRMPLPGYVITHRGFMNMFFGYNDSYFLSRPDEFELLKTFGTEDPVSVYKIVPSS